MDLARLLADQHSQAVQACLQAGAQARELGSGAGQVVLGLLDRQIVAQACLKTPGGQLVGVFLGLDVGSGRSQTGLGGAGIDVVGGHFAEQTDQHIAQVFPAGGEIGTGRFHRAADAAENVQLPAGIETGVV